MKWHGGYSDPPNFDVDEHYELECSGRLCYANNGILGLNPDADDVTEGYDGGFESRYEDKFTPAERQEIGNHMIALWTTWRDRLVP